MFSGTHGARTKTSGCLYWARRDKSKYVRLLGSAACIPIHGAATI